MSIDCRLVREIGQTTVAWRKTDRLVEARPKLAGSQKKRTKRMKTKMQTRKVHLLLISRGTGRPSGLKRSLKRPREWKVMGWEESQRICGVV